MNGRIGAMILVLAGSMLVLDPASSNAQSFGFAISSGGGGHHHHHHGGWWAGYGVGPYWGPGWGPGWYGPPPIVYAAPPVVQPIYVQPQTVMPVTPTARAPYASAPTPPANPVAADTA